MRFFLRGQTMLQVIFSTDKTQLNEIYEKLLPNQKVEGANFLLIENEIPIGVCKIELSNFAEIAEIEILEEKNSPKVMDFFVRTILYKLSFNKMLVKVDSTDEKWKMFGFQEENGQMVVSSNNITFPSDCCGHNE